MRVLILVALVFTWFIFVSLASIHKYQFFKVLLFVTIRRISFSGHYFLAFELNKNRKNFKYAHFLRSDSYSQRLIPQNFLKTFKFFNIKVAIMDTPNRHEKLKPTLTVPLTLKNSITLSKIRQYSKNWILKILKDWQKALHEEYHYSWFTNFSKIAELLGETNDFSASTVQRKSALSRILENQRCSNRIKHSQGKLRF